MNKFFQNREIWVIAVLLLLALAVPLFGETFYTRFATRILIFGMAALAVNILLGYGGLISLGHAAFFGVAAYATGMMTNAGMESGFVVWPLAILASLVAAAVIGALSLRTTGLYFIMITLAFAQLLFYFGESLRSYGGSDGFRMNNRNDFLGLVNLADPTSFYYLTLGLLVVVIAFCARMLRAEFGVVLRGSRDNSVRIEAIGYPSYRYKLVAFIISGGIAGLAGVLMANLDLYIAPTGMLNWMLSGELLMMVIFGSAATLVGPVFGAAIYLIAAEFLSEMTEHWMLFFGPILIARVMFLKDGLYGLLLKGISR